MTLPALDKKKIIAALMNARKNYEGSDTAFASIHGINPSVFSQLKQGKPTEDLITDDSLVGIAMTLNVSLIGAPEWKIAETTAFMAYTELLRACQSEGRSRIICDKSDRGKTTAAKHYMLNNKNAFYICCSEHKTLKRLVYAMCRAMGLKIDGTQYDRIQRIKRFLLWVESPIVMLDEFGDLKYDAFLEMKAFWNASEDRCAWVVIGAQALKKKLESGKANDKVGFEEFMRRFGDDFMTAATIRNDADERKFFMSEAEKVVKVNMPKAKVTELIPMSEMRGQILSLTRIKERIIKMKRTAA